MKNICLEIIDYEQYQRLLETCDRKLVNEKDLERMLGIEKLRYLDVVTYNWTLWFLEKYL